VSEPSPTVIEGSRRRPSPFARLERWIFRGSFGGTLEPVRLVRADGHWRMNDEILAPGQFASGFLEPTGARGGPSRVRVCLIDRDHERALDVLVSGVDEGQMLLETLGLDPRRRAMTFLATSFAGSLLATVSFLLGITLMLALPFGVLTRLLLGVPLIALGALSMRSARYPVTISPDGITLQRLGGERFVPYAEVTMATAHGENTLTLKVNGRETLTFELPASGVVGESSLPFGWHPLGEHAESADNMGGSTQPTANHAVARYIRGALPSAEERSGVDG